MRRCSRPPFYSLGSCLLSSGSTDVWQSLVRWQRPWKWLLVLHMLRLSPHSEAIRSEDPPTDGTSPVPDLEYDFERTLGFDSTAADQQDNLNDGFELESDSDVLDESVLYDEKAKEGKSGVGQSCHGSRYHSRGDCGSIYVQAP